MGLATLTLVLAAHLFVDGIFEIIYAFRARILGRSKFEGSGGARARASGLTPFPHTASGFACSGTAAVVVAHVSSGGESQWSRTCSNCVSPSRFARRC